jgi:hypothetical protein
MVLRIQCQLPSRNLPHVLQHYRFEKLVLQFPCGNELLLQLNCPSSVAPKFLIHLQVCEYVKTSIWGGLYAVVPSRYIMPGFIVYSGLLGPHTDTLWYFQGEGPLPVSLTIDDAPGDL